MDTSDLRIHADGQPCRRSLHAEADLDIDGGVSVTDAHALAHEAEHRLTHQVPKLRSATIHAYRPHGTRRGTG